MSKKKILDGLISDDTNRLCIETKYNSLGVVIRYKEVDTWLSSVLNTIAKKEREKMAKALRMTEESSPKGMTVSKDKLEGFNEAVKHFNRVLDDYIKKHE